ncbi:MAG: exodeoxyribonuclease VII large subunit [Bacilli bacterium]|nr:exodeoxyribonuclease VII large subunit [Bacilli bacterium]
MKDGVYSVHELNQYIKTLFDHDGSLRLVKLEGELQDVKLYPSGHMYFNVTDEAASISGVMFDHDVAGLDFKPKNGDKVLLIGSVSTYVKTGRYQIYVRAMYLDGAGAKLLALKKLREKLEKEGLFSRAKRNINRYPKAIGLITARGSAACADLVTNITRRYPLVNVYAFYTSVQGKEAPKEIVNALKKAYAFTSKLDTIIISRGGGSSEDLDAFNDELVVRTAFTSPVPLIAAIGHEVDFTLVEYVADIRASTPTAAAEYATIDKREIYEQLDTCYESMTNSLNARIQLIRDKLHLLMNRPFFINPSSIYQDKLNNIKLTKENLENAWHLYLTGKINDLSTRKERLEAINPARVLKRGFALLRAKNGKVIKQVEDVEVGETMETVMSNGKIYAQVTQKEKHV